jgi:tRNA pseudouridine55 synthase
VTGAGAAAPGQRKPWRDVDGILLLDKPLGISSNAALQRARRLFRARKAGHTGSLDPLASGMLPLCLGEATKFSGHLLDADKVYEVRAHWGTRTETGDRDGAVTASSAITEVSREALEAALGRFTGEISQVPPMYSALKHQGRRLYDLARAGQEVPRPPRQIRIHDLAITRFDPTEPVLQVHCSKGTYIRTLVEDLAAALGTEGHVAALRRVAVAPFGGEVMVTLEALEAVLAEKGEAGLDAFLLPPDRGLAGLPELHLDPAQAEHVLQGNPVLVPGGHAAGLLRLYGPGHRFLGVGEGTADGRVRPRRLVAH